MLIIVELTVLIITLVGMLLGSCCIYWVKVRPASARRAWWGCCLFVVTLLTRSASPPGGRLDAGRRPAPLGLLSGLLIVGMLWESPVAIAGDDSKAS